MVVSLKSTDYGNLLGLESDKATSAIPAAPLTFRLQLQAGMRARRWVWKSIAVYDL